MGQYIVPVIVALLGSGVWTFVGDLVRNRSNRETAEKRMLLGLGHDRLYENLDMILTRGYVTVDELENLEYLYKPYKELGGNGTCERMYEQVNRLPHEKAGGDK